MQRKEDRLFHEVRNLMLELMDWRKQILAKALPKVCNMLQGSECLQYSSIAIKMLFHLPGSVETIKAKSYSNNRLWKQVCGLSDDCLCGGKDLSFGFLG